MPDKKSIHLDQLDQYVAEEKALSPFVRQTVYRTASGSGTVHFLPLYPGVEIWTFDFNIKNVSVPALENKRSLMLNYCYSGRYEMRLPDNQYVYVHSGVLCIDKTPPFGRTIIPIGEYAGMEIAFQLDVLEKALPISWTDCGIRLELLEKFLTQKRGSYLAQATPEYDRIIRLLGTHIHLADWPMEHYRYHMLRLLWTLQNEEQNHTPYVPIFLTTGQRAAVMRVETLLTKNLSRRYVIADVAEAEGISASTLKKHFSLVYGKPISSYLKERRIEKAKKLLTQTKCDIEEISNAVGYENQGKFAVMFREQTGVSPLEYRRLNKTKPSGKQL